jgi:hypothetical protein
VRCSGNENQIRHERDAHFNFANAPADRRGGVLSALYFVAFVMQAVVVRLLGAVATAWGLAIAVDPGTVTIALLSICAIGLALSSGRGLPPEPVSGGLRIREQSCPPV